MLQVSIPRNHLYSNLKVLMIKKDVNEDCGSVRTPWNLSPILMLFVSSVNSLHDLWPFLKQEACISMECGKIVSCPFAVRSLDLYNALSDP